MQVSTNHIVLSVVIVTLILLIAGSFLVLYVRVYNNRKKKHFEEKQMMQQAFEEELVKTQMEVQEQTLKTIASDIHDNIGQILSFTKLTLSTVKVQEEPAKAQMKVDNAVTLISDSIKQLRQLASVLHADSLIAHGLEHAIENELNWLSKSDAFQINWKTEGKKTANADAKRDLVAFRIVQELLNNTIKHSNATVIDVSLTYHEAGIEISVVDNGKGFDVEDSLKVPNGIGLANLFKRATMLGGELRIGSRENNGTCAILNVPYTT